MRAVRFLVLAFALIASAPTHAVQPVEVLPDPALEARARELSVGLRCMVCQNESIDASAAPLARDLRLLVRERLVAGDTNAEVEDYLVSRYGEFVLLQPRMNWQTMALWIAPAAILSLGMIFLIVAARRGRRPAAGLSADEERRIAELLDGR